MLSASTWRLCNPNSINTFTSGPSRGLVNLLSIKWAILSPAHRPTSRPHFDVVARVNTSRYICRPSHVQQSAGQSSPLPYSRSVRGELVPFWLSGSSGHQGNAAPLLVSLLGNKLPSVSSRSSSRASYNAMSDPLIPSAASSWTKTTLEALNVSFDRHQVHDFAFDGLAMPSDLEQRMSPSAFPN